MHTLTRCSSLLLICSLLTPAAAQDAPELGTPEYQTQDAEAKRDTLWEAIAADPYEADALPTGGVITGALKLIGAKFSLRPTFDDRDDVRDERGKTFHRWGTTAKVRFVPNAQGMAQTLMGGRADDGYTGVFATGAVGIARLSLGLGDVLYAPGIGLKLFVDGQPSVNVHAIPRDGGQDCHDFLKPSLSSEIDPTPLDGFLKWASKANPGLRTVLPLAMVEADGTAVESPRAPHHIEFRPAVARTHDHAAEAEARAVQVEAVRRSFTPISPGMVFAQMEAVRATEKAPYSCERTDFRETLAAIPAGTTLYEVWALDATGTEGARQIGTLVTESGFVASAFQDRRLHFHHADESRIGADE